jgi:membrane protein implicated in regulation of membrane protease activity
LVSFGHCVVCLSFDLQLLIAFCYLLAIVLSVLPWAIRSRKSKEGQTTQWPKDTKGKSEAVNQMEGQTIQWPKHNKGKSEAVNQRKDRQYNGCLSFL